MNSQTKFLRIILGLFLLLSAITLVSCKKDKEVEDLKKSSFMEYGLMSKEQVPIATSLLI